MALRIIAHLPDHEKLTLDNLKTIARGTHLRELDRNDVIEQLRNLKLIRKIKNASAYRLSRSLFSQ